MICSPRILAAHVLGSADDLTGSDGPLTEVMSTNRIQPTVLHGAMETLLGTGDAKTALTAPWRNAETRSSTATTGYWKASTWSFS